jgi:hypothetical protein
MSMLTVSDFHYPSYPSRFESGRVGDHVGKNEAWAPRKLTVRELRPFSTHCNYNFPEALYSCLILRYNLR